MDFIPYPVIPVLDPQAQDLNQPNCNINSFQGLRSQSKGVEGKPDGNGPKSRELDSYSPLCLVKRLPAYLIPGMRSFPAFHCRDRLERPENAKFREWEQQLGCDQDKLEHLLLPSLVGLTPGQELLKLEAAAPQSGAQGATMVYKPREEEWECF